LWVKDELVDKAWAISRQKMFSFDVFNDTYKSYRPKGYSRNLLKKMMPDGVVLRIKLEDVVFSNDEKARIIDRWNDSLGRDFVSPIFRKNNYDYEGTVNDDEGNEKIVGVHNEREFRSVKQLEVLQMLTLVANSGGLEGAEWKNYMGTPMTKGKGRMMYKGKWVEVPRHIESVFGTPYLAESDWKIY